MQLETEMEYTIRLADPQFQKEFEDLFKLASLLDSIGKLQHGGAVANSDLELQFRAAIKTAYETNGTFRQEVERFAEAKRLIASIQLCSQ